MATVDRAQMLCKVAARLYFISLKVVALNAIDEVGGKQLKLSPLKRLLRSLNGGKGEGVGTGVTHTVPGKCMEG